MDLKQMNAKILDEVPAGWKPIAGAMTAPVGYRWYSNGKSRFGGEYEQALVKEEKNAKGNQQGGS